MNEKKMELNMCSMKVKLSDLTGNSDRHTDNGPTNQPTGDES